MAEAIKHENDLVAIKVKLDPDVPPSMPTAVRFEVERAGERRFRASVDAAALGVPPDLEPPRYRYGEPAFKVPERLLSDLRREFEAALEGDISPVAWLHISSPAGFLPLVPWERLLGPTFERPILRVPHFALFPPLDTEGIDIAICVSQPRAKGEFEAAEAVMTVAQRLTAAAPGASTVHVFADAPTYRALHRAGFDRADRGGARRLYDPALAPPAERTRGRSEIDDTATTWNPWLAWISSQVGDHTLEAVHFVGHTYLARDQAALAVAESPLLNEDRQWARFIGSRQLASFLDQVGAWSVGLSTPEYNFSPMGARLLVDDLAHRRAGPVLLHEFASDPGAEQLGRTMTSLFHGDWPSEPSNIALYCHPRVFSVADERESLPFAESLLADPRIGGPVPVAEQPAWVTLTRRYLEQSAARLFPEVEQPTSSIQLATGEGVRQALSFVSDVISSFETGPAGRPTVGRADADRPESRA
jgi:hypothetical protein